MKLPRAMARINAELHRRFDAGECVTYDFAPEILTDEQGYYLRITLTFTDGSTYAFDSDEATPLLRLTQLAEADRAVAH